MGRCQPLLLASAALISTAHAQADEFILAGACDHKSYLDGLAFTKQGMTHNGAPWYKALGQEEYIYWDPDCSGGEDGTARWVIDSDRPNEEVDSDLDGDGRCEYHARLNSGDKKHPPAGATWYMACTEGWRSQFVMLAGTPSVDGPISTVTKTTTSPSPTGGRATSTTVTVRPVRMETSSGEDDEIDPEPEAARLSTTPCPRSSSMRSGADVAPQVLVLEGACAMRDCNLNGLAFMLEGRTADGAPYYKASGREEYLYREAGNSASCEGGSPGTAARWVLGRGRPGRHGGSGALDESRCDDRAHVDSAAGEGGAAARPPAEATWRMRCGAGAAWQEVAVTLREVKTTTPAVVFVSGSPGEARTRGLLLLLVLPLLCLVPK